MAARGLHYNGFQKRRDTIITLKKPWIANKRLDLIITVPISVLEQDCPFSAAFRYNDIVTWCAISVIFSYSKRCTGDSLIASVTKHTFWATWRRVWRLFIHGFKKNGKQLSWLRNCFIVEDTVSLGTQWDQPQFSSRKYLWGYGTVKLMQVSHLEVFTT